MKFSKKLSKRNLIIINNANNKNLDYVESSF